MIQVYARAVTSRMLPAEIRPDQGELENLSRLSHYDPAPTGERGTNRCD